MKRNRSSKSRLLVLARVLSVNLVRVSFLVAIGIAQSQPGDAAEKPDFERNVRPILVKHCIDCHGRQEQNGGVNFEIRSSVFAEANSGKAVILPGDASGSELIRRIETAGEDEQMPPEGERLTTSEIDLLKTWINEGADWSDQNSPHPDGLDDGVAGEFEREKPHWAFMPITASAPPPVKDKTWALSVVDEFIQAKRESLGLSPVDPAEPLVLLRRACYDLTGLPPTPAEANSFLAEVESSGLGTAFSNWVDNLLNRSSYGQRWGRHWMDWVRYADTAGDNSDFPIPQAYLYRNYIIDSLNQDLPYDRFLVEQLAGDLLPAGTLKERNRQVIATGYLAMSRRFGSLVERYPWHLTIEDTIDNVGRTMLGLTLSCARCHDHKFDPISTRDYYGLYGIFASTQYPFPGIELFQAQWNFVPLIPSHDAERLLAPYQEKTNELARALDDQLEKCRIRAEEDAERESQASLAEQRRMRDELDAMLLRARKAGEALADHLKTTPQIATAYAVRDGTPQNARIQIKGDPFRPGAEVPRKFPDVLGGQTLESGEAESLSGRLQLANWITDPENPLTARVIVNRVWQRHFGTGLVPSTSDFGERGELPTHPELLDWLATEFMSNGWSLKKLHRTIMTSQTYQLSSFNTEENIAKDPGNHSYWKFNRRRLDAESIRDSLLFLSGELDATPQTTPYPIPPVKEWEYTQHHPYKEDYSSNRRSVYLMTKRLTVKPYLQTFDGPDPNVCTSDRSQSVTPLQALYFVNDEFVHEQAERLTELLLKQSCSDTARIEQAFVKILSRPPTPIETKMALQHLDNVQKFTIRHADRDPSGPGDDAAHSYETWSSLIRSLFRLNEFLYVD